MALKLGVFLLAVLAAVHLLPLVGEEEYLIKLLLDGGDASWIFAFDYVGYGLRECEFLLLDNLAVLNDVDGDIVVYKAEDIEVDEV